MTRRIFQIICCVLLVWLCLAGCTSSTAVKGPRVLVRTGAGNFVIELYPDKAPKSVAAFLSYVDSGYYKNATFYRVMNQDNQPSDAFKAKLIQGGLWRTNRKLAQSLKGIPHETTKQTGLRHEDMTVSLARLEPGTATTEFFICLGTQPGFDYGGTNNPDLQGYAAFGKVVEGMNIVTTIYNRPESDEVFEPPVWIYDIVRL